MAPRKPTEANTFKSLNKSAQRRKRAPGPVIALTGVTGFLGGSILQRLDADPRYSRIIALDRRKPQLETKKTKFYRFNLTETLADSKLAAIFEKEGVNIVIHSAFPITPDAR